LLEEVAEATVVSVLTELEKALVKRVSSKIRDIEGEGSEELLRETIYVLDAIERIERIKQLLLASKHARPSESREGKR